VTNNKAEAMAWAVWCPPTDECDYRVYFTHADAEVADDGFRNSAMTDEDDAERRTQGVVPLYPTPPAGHIMESDGTVRKVLGTLRTLKDGPVPGDGADVFMPCANGLIKWRLYISGGSTNEIGDAAGSSSFVDRCYSTAEAAQRAAGGGA
jgi:hypothetical protein